MTVTAWFSRSGEVLISMDPTTACHLVGWMEKRNLQSAGGEAVRVWRALKIVVERDVPPTLLREVDRFDAG
jgi:hypothetical protein